MKASQNSSTLVLATVAVVATCAALVSGYGWYRAGETASTGGQNGVTDDHAGHDHADHDHEGHDHSSGEILHLSEAGLKNIDYQPLTVALSDYVKTLSLPAIIVERPGQTQIHV